MTFEFNLRPNAKVRSRLQFWWNESTGEVSGPGAELVRSKAATALRLGYILVSPVPSSIECTENPLNSRALLAALLSYDYRLSKVLADALISAPDEEDEDSGEFEGVEFIVVDDSEITF